jgi:ferredoxin
MAHAQCTIVAPEVFQLTDGPVPEAIVLISGDIPTHLEGQVDAAVQSCPAGAIVVDGKRAR